MAKWRVARPSGSRTSSRGESTPLAEPVKPPLPLRDGVAPSFVWLAPGDWPDMLAFLTGHFRHIPEATWLARIARGEVVYADGEPVTASGPYRSGRQVYYYRELEAETPIPFTEQILFEDEDLLVVDKPHFLPVIPGGRFLQETLLVRLKKSTGLTQLTPIHRLDRETAGVIIFSHKPATRGLYQSLFQKRAMNKIYHALAPHAEGVAMPITRRSCIARGEPFFRMREIDGPANSETRIEVLERQGELSLYELRPVTGRQHQLRVHLAGLGIPIVNDGFYPAVQQSREDDWSRPLQLLAKQISFDDPQTGARRSFSSARKLSLIAG